MDLVWVEFKVVSRFDIKPEDRYYPVFALPRVGERIGFATEGFEFKVESVLWVTETPLEKSDEVVIKKVVLGIF